MLLFFCADAPNARTQRVRYARAWVRICHSEIGELAHQAESAQIFAKGEIPVFSGHQLNRWKDLTKNGTTKVVPFFALQAQ